MMESGTHTLSSAVSLSNIYNFTMAPVVPNSNVQVVCSTQSNATGSFSLTSVSFVQLQGVSIEGCAYSKFGTNGDSVLIIGVSFSNLVEGGMLIRNISNRVQLNNVTFTNSDVTEIDTTPTTLIQMRDIVFNSGRSIRIGPASEISIEDSTFQGGSASALYLYNITQGTVVRCRLHDNNARDSHSNGGALNVLYSASVLINESTFYGNSAEESGGDIYANNSNIIIDRSTFTGNSVSGVFVYKVNLTVMNSNFSDNRAISGAAINAVRCHSVQIIGCTFANNDATNEYGGIWFGNGGALRTYLCETVLISSSHFINNSAVYAGAILCHDGNTFTVTDCSFSLNAASHDEGGAMRVYASQVTLLRSVFDSNWASTKGGAIYVTGTVTANWSNFTNNRADIGGALYVYTVHSQLSVSHGYFKNNTATNGSGGAIFNDGQTDTSVSLVDSTFEYNSATSCGVLNIDIYIFHSILNFSGSTFRYNTATGQSVGGGVVCVKDASISVVESTFSHNSAALHAGVMYVDDSVLKVERSSFISNFAKENGGVMYTNTSSTNYTISLSSFDNNTAGDSGGVMFIGANSQVSMERSSCGHNSAANRGGVMTIVESNLVINETNIFNNTARLGGAVSACNSDVTLPGELAGREDPTDSECILYNGYINRYNFTHQEVSTTTSMPVTMTTTASTTTKHTFTTTTQTGSTTAGTTHASTTSLVTTSGSQTASPTTSSGGPTTKNALTTSTQTESPTTDRIPNTPYTSVLTSTTVTGSEHTSPINTSENTSQPTSDSLKINIIIAVSCVSVFVTICLCILIGVYVTIKIIGKLKRRSEYRYSLHNDNEFLMQEAE